jgi:hypothetical protein
MRGKERVDLPPGFREKLINPTTRETINKGGREGGVATRFKGKIDKSYNEGRDDKKRGKTTRLIRVLDLDYVKQWI